MIALLKVTFYSNIKIFLSYFNLNATNLFLKCDVILNDYQCFSINYDGHKQHQIQLNREADHPGSEDETLRSKNNAWPAKWNVQYLQQKCQTDVRLQKGAIMCLEEERLCVCFGCESTGLRS